MTEPTRRLRTVSARNLYMDKQDLGGAPPYSVFHSQMSKGNFPTNKVSKHAKGRKKGGKK